MKKIFNILLAASMSALVLTSCQEKTLTVYHPEDMVAPQFTENLAASYDIKEGGEFVTLKISEASYGVATSIRYTAVADVKQDFSSKQNLTSVTDCSEGITVDANTINNALMTLNCPFDEPVTVYLRVEAEMMSESNPVEGMETLVTGSLETKVAAFVPQSLIQENMWGATGDFTEARNWKLYSYLSEFPPKSKIYTTPAITMAEGGQFILHFNNKAEYGIIGGTGKDGDTKLKVGVPVDITIDDPNAVNFGVGEGQAGSQVIVLDSAAKKMYFLGWGVIGQVSGDGWANDAPMLYDETAGTWTAQNLEFNKDGEFKIRMKKAWDDDRGLDDNVKFALNTPMKVKKGGGNITVKEAGYYEVVYNEKDETITVTKLRDLEKEE